MVNRWVVITDLDGTFLEGHGDGGQSMLPAADILRRAAVPIVFCSSKTRAEIDALRSELKIHDPFIVENGGAIYMEEGYFQFPIENAAHHGKHLCISLGTDYADLEKALEDVELQTGCRIERFGRAGVEEISRVTGLGMAEAARAKQREFDEPFWFVTSDSSLRRDFLRRLRRLPGLRVTRGDRLYHLKGATDKGNAVEILKTYYLRMWPTARFIGVGNGTNDIPWLRLVDFPVLMRTFGGEFNRDLAAALPHAFRSPAGAGPKGWAVTVLPLLSQVLRNG
jgi:mannosyl-3-phosphoglycerate phosphatase